MLEKREEKEMKTYLNISALFSARQSPCNNLEGHRIDATAHRFVETQHFRLLDIQNIHLLNSERILRVCFQKDFSYWKTVQVPIYAKKIRKKWI
jgi:hypothetical protein